MHCELLEDRWSAERSNDKSRSAVKSDVNEDQIIAKDPGVIFIN